MRGVDERQMLADLKQFDEDSRWLSENRETLRRHHPDKFVSVHRREVVAVADSHEELMRNVRGRGLDPAKCANELIMTDDVVWVL